MSLAPVSDMILIKVPNDSNEAFQRLDINLKYFKINYFLICLAITTITLTVMNPWFFTAVGLLAGVAIFLINNKDPIKVGDNNFLKVTVMARVYIVTALVFYAAFGGVAFLIAVGLSFLLCVVHAALTEVEATRKLKSITITANETTEMERGMSQLVARGYELLCLAIGLKESNEVYNMTSVPSFVAKEIKQDFKDLKNNIKSIFKD